MMSKSGALTFRVYPESKHSFYFVVNIWQTKSKMRRHCFWMSGKFDAMSTGYSSAKTKNGASLKQIGEVNFYKSIIGGGIVSHELLHSALRWLERTKLADGAFVYKNGQACKAEEMLCYALHAMTNQFWVHYYKNYPTQ